MNTNLTNLSNINNVFSVDDKLVLFETILISANYY